MYNIYTSVHRVVYSRVHGMRYNVHLITVHKHSILYGFLLSSLFYSQRKQNRFWTTKKLFRTNNNPAVDEERDDGNADMPAPHMQVCNAFCRVAALQI